MIGKLFRRWATPALRKQVRELRSELEACQLQAAVTEAERDALAAVVARDRSRIEAESAAYARSKAEAEGVGNDDQRTR